MKVVDNMDISSSNAGYSMKEHEKKKKRIRGEERERDEIQFEQELRSAEIQNSEASTKEGVKLSDLMVAAANEFCQNKLSRHCLR